MCGDCQPCCSNVGVVDAHLGLARRALCAEVPVRERGAVEVERLAAGEVLGRHPAVVVADERSTRSASAPSTRSRTREQTVSISAASIPSALAVIGLLPSRSSWSLLPRGRGRAGGIRFADVALTAGFRRPSGARAIRAGAACSAALGAAWCAPALAPVVAAGERRAAPRAAGPARRRGRAHVRRRAASARHAGRARAAARARRARRRSSWSASRCARTGSLLAEIAAAGHGVAVHGDRHRTLLRLPPAAIARDLDRAADAIARDGVVPRCTARPTASTPGRRCARCARRGWTPLLWSRWGHDWRAAPRRSASRGGRRAAHGRATCCCCTTPTTTARRAPGARTVAALPRVLDAIAAAGLRAGALAGAQRSAAGR